MTYFRLSREGYEKLSTQVQSLQETVNKADLNPFSVFRLLGDIRLGLCRLNQILYTGEMIDPALPRRRPLGPGAA